MIDMSVCIIIQSYYLYTARPPESVRLRGHAFSGPIFGLIAYFMSFALNKEYMSWHCCNKVQRPH